MRIHWLCIRICIRLNLAIQFINVVLYHDKSDKLYIRTNISSLSHYDIIRTVK